MVSNYLFVIKYTQKQRGKTNFFIRDLYCLWNDDILIRESEFLHNIMEFFLFGILFLKRNIIYFSHEENIKYCELKALPLSWKR